ncbi:MAG: MurR/RpiR family transcriptional regulator [Clostridia bacterium]|nr:MurR/RpiR family transcriptional regulator [Clostridia bacterium]MBQ3652309.1 MurR/RpiR family transcriptional regulator [Clostridia bacterium]MBQ6358205.1 MurR/RpiR family transcriptional regulator [Clostridia bacterium]MBQ6892411.1 MurR/RpiR family transcriptional regulator [Clostridia bacterium]MBQ9323025.1 MurR/RpiR family transcriptional regulator [Clostridia bacterium]
MMNNLLQEIHRRMPSLSKGQQRIADFIINSYEQAAFMTAARLGETVGVSESTVVRFAYALGLEGYPALQDRMQEMVLGRLTSVQRAQLASGLKKNEVFKTVLTTDMNSIRTTMEMADEGQFDQAVETILKARKVYVLGLRSAMPLAMFLAYYLDYICGNVITFSANIQDLRETMVRMNDQDAFICISFPRYSSRTAEAMAYAKSRGARTIALTDKLDSPIGTMADVVLLAKSDMASFADSLTAPLSVINAIIVAAGLQSEEEVQDHLRELENVWNRDQVYLTDGGDNR